ncbi:MAG: MoaD/ThiS family protein [Halioglobus sp.]|nr:MoaD/ThiS family protein [Halioglobus sp.]
MIRIVLPFHLQTLASCGREVTVTVDGAVTLHAVLDALEARYPMLRGTIREHITLRFRPRVRFFANTDDVTHASPDAALPTSIAAGEEPLRIVGAVSGG